MMKRRWSNNGGFALRMLEESSSEVTSSSAGLVMASVGGMTMSPTSLGSPEYGELELWYDESGYNQHSVIASAVAGNMVGVGVGGNGGGVTGNNGIIGCMNNQNTMIPLPSMTNNSMNHTPRSASANSISSGEYFYFLFY